VTTVKYIDVVPYQADPEVRAVALRIFQDSRVFFGATDRRGNDTLKHCENVAVRMVRTYTLMGNKGGSENALLYAKVAELFGALWYYSSGAQRRIQYRHLRADLYKKASA
jgi:hypothetical protein